MKYIQYTVFILFISLFISSCNSYSIYYTSIDVRKPALLTFNIEGQNVLIVDNSPVTMSYNNPDTSFIVMPDTARYITLGLFHDYMTDEGVFERIDFYTKNLNGGNEVKQLSAQQIKSLCRQYDSDIVISFDLLGLLVPHGKEFFTYKHRPSASGYASAIIRIYHKDSLDVDKPLGTPLLFTQPFAGVRNDLWMKMEQNIYEKNNLFTYELQVWSDKMTRDFIPYWSSQERFYYTNDKSEMKQAFQYAQEGNWQEAAKVWGELYELETKNINKVRLAANIALANEYLDDPEFAKEWIDVAYDLLEEDDKSILANNVKIYRAQLRDRVREAPIIKKQLEPFIRKE